MTDAKGVYMRSCYLIQINLIAGHDKHGQPITKFVGCGAWSSPPWESSRIQRNQTWSVLWESKGEDFHEARLNLAESLRNKHHPFHWALPWVDDTEENFDWRKRWTDELK